MIPKFISFHAVVVLVSFIQIVFGYAVSPYLTQVDPGEFLIRILPNGGTYVTVYAYTQYHFQF